MGPMGPIGTIGPISPITSYRLNLLQPRDKCIPPVERSDGEPDKALCFEGAKVGNQIAPKLYVKCFQPIVKRLLKHAGQVFLIVEIDNEELAAGAKIAESILDRI